MFQEDSYPEELDDYNNNLELEETLENSKMMDRGYNKVYRMAVKTTGRNKGRIYNKKIEIYSSSGVGSNIRDAETGQYYSNIVGSKDEDLFFKVILATGECKSKNGSSTLFFVSPQHYSSHLLCDVSDEIVSKWEKKRDARLKELKVGKKQNSSYVEVR